MLVKELIQQDATAKNLAAEAMAMFQNPQRLAHLRDQLLQLRQSLGEPGVAQRAAQAILTDLQQK